MADTENRAQPAAKGASPITVFAIKTAIVAAACVLSIVAIASYIDAIVESRIDQITQSVVLPGTIGGHDFWIKVEKALDEEANPKHDMPPERRKKILADIRVISDRWRPFIAEAFGQRTDEQPPTNASAR
jgi:hypothetical protein